MATWTVELTDQLETERVVADGWTISDNGDISFVDNGYKQGVFMPAPVAAYASGVWSQVRRYA